MRELLAKQIALATGLLVLSVAVGFAWLQNYVRTDRPQDPETEVPIPLEPIDPQVIGNGEMVYDAQSCAACHSIAGQGNQRYPLDGVGARLTAGEIKLWIAPTADMQSKLPYRAYKSKQQFHKLSAEEMDALIQYMTSLR
jgi:mono/diheme cytochrome c family protein